MKADSKTKEKSNSSFIMLYRLTAIAVVIWTIIIGGLLAWYIDNENKQAIELANKEASTIFNKDLAFRKWVASHGGLYVPPDERTPPNPYLSNVPERDITTTTNQTLTLMNPAYVMRQVMGDYESLFGVKGHITSLELVNPVNAPDEWEQEALLAFEQGETEISGVIDNNGLSYNILMRPLIVEEACLKCHGYQGYKVGDVRGGVSVAVPMAAYLTKADEGVKAQLWAYGLVFFLGLGGISFVSLRSKQYMKGSKQAEDEKAKLEQQLKQNQRLESIGRLAGGVAHDLNNMLTPILGFGELLQKDFTGDEEQGEQLEEIVKAGRRARDLVGQLLVFGRKQALEFTNVDLNAVLKNFEKLLRSTIREDINIQLIPIESLPLIRGDIGRLEQVVMNLAVNAQDAMPDGGELTIETSVVNLDDSFSAQHDSVIPGPYVMLAVSDTGSGMDAEIREHIFEPFFTTKAKGKGTGLGLSTTYGIVKQHGGNIWVYSEPGKGTTFKIYLPVSGETQIEQKTAEKTYTAIHGSETILLVEDDEIVRKLALTVLKQSGYTILVAENGAEALLTLKSHDGPVHLLLTDVVMPGMNGRELFNMIIEKYPNLRVLYMSGYTDSVIAHHGVPERGVAFIQKPFAINDLAAKIREVLD